MLKLKYRIGKVLRQAGFDLQPVWKREAGSLNLVELGALALLGSGRLNFILQIGAYDGEETDPLLRQVIPSCRRSVLVEPQPEAAARLRDRYRNHHDSVMIVEAAIGDQDGEAMLYSGGRSASPKASLNKNHLKSRFNESATREIVVKTIAPGTLLTTVGLGDPDLLQIDTEGMDWKILRQFFDAGCRPLIINFEHLHLPRSEALEARSVLRDLGYEWRMYGWDTVAVSSKLWQEFGKFRTREVEHEGAGSQ